MSSAGANDVMASVQRVGHYNDPDMLQVRMNPHMMLLLPLLPNTAAAAAFCLLPRLLLLLLLLTKVALG